MKTDYGHKSVENSRPKGRKVKLIIHHITTAWDTYTWNPWKLIVIEDHTYLGKVPVSRKFATPTLKFLLISVFIAFLSKNFLRLQQSPPPLPTYVEDGF